MEYEKRGKFDRFISKIFSRFNEMTRTVRNEQNYQSQNVGWLPGERSVKAYGRRFDSDRMRDNISEIMD